uniref:tetratricopeptide repeat protein n=1 Tax=Spirosoma sp. TaxID=1899569 RepID=UPI003B3AF76C
GQGQIGAIERICQSKGVYLVYTASRSTRTVLFRNVTRNACNVAIVNLFNVPLNGPQGQIAFDNLLKRTNFQRYARPEPSKSEALPESTPNTAVVTEPTNQVGNNPAVQQVSAQVNNYEPNANQTNLAVQSPVQSITDNLRVESVKMNDKALQNGIDAYRRGQYAEAITFYDEYLAGKKNRNSAYVLNLKGYAQFRLRQYEQAVTTLLAATKADPKYAWAYFDLARVYCAMGRESEANQAREQAISLRADMQSIMQNDQEFMNLCGRGATAK